MPTWTKRLKSRTLRGRGSRGTGGRRAWERPKPSCRRPTYRRPTGLKGTRRELAMPALRPNFWGAQEKTGDDL